MRNSHVYSKSSITLPIAVYGNSSLATAACHSICLFFYKYHLKYSLTQAKTGRPGSINSAHTLSYLFPMAIGCKTTRLQMQVSSGPIPFTPQRLPGTDNLSINFRTDGSLPTFDSYTSNLSHRAGRKRP